MKFPKVGELRIKAMIDFEGDYVAAVQMYRGFWKGWTNVRSFYTSGYRDAAQCIALARQYVREAQPVQLGIVK